MRILIHAHTHLCANAFYAHRYVFYAQTHFMPIYIYHAQTHFLYLPY